MYGVCVFNEPGDGTANFYAVLAETSEEAVRMMHTAGYVPDEYRCMVVPLNQLLWEEYRGIALLGTAG